MTSSWVHVTGRLVVMATLLLLPMTSSRGDRLRRHRLPTFGVDEQVPVGHVVGNVTSLAVTSRGGRGFALLAARCGDCVPGEKAANLFAINSESGILRTAEIIDREKLCGRRTPSCLVSLDLAVLPRFDVVTVDVEILDVNDNAPSFGDVNAITRHVIESATPTGPVFLLPVAVDPDVGDNGAVEYQLEPGTSPFRLAVSPDHASELSVELVQPLDRETVYVFTISLAKFSCFLF